jgi:hypothetical protein
MHHKHYSTIKVICQVFIIIYNLLSFSTTKKSLVFTSDFLFIRLAVLQAYLSDGGVDDGGVLWSFFCFRRAPERLCIPPAFRDWRG